MKVELIILLSISVSHAYELRRSLSLEGNGFNSIKLRSLFSNKSQKLISSWWYRSEKIEYVEERKLKVSKKKK